MANHGDCKQIESGACVVDDVANDGAELSRDAFLYTHLPKAFSRRVIVLDENFVRISGEKGCGFLGQFANVAFGPVNF